MTGLVSIRYLSRGESLLTEIIASYQIYALKNGDPTESPHSAALKNWWDAFPTIKSSPASLTAEEVAILIRGQGSQSDFAVIDVRRNDHAVC